jgi:hypothetical protein
VSPPLQTNTDDLRTWSSKLSGHADAVSKINPSTGPHDAAAAMPNTAFGGACSYDATDAAFTAQLKQYEAGVK